MSSPDCSKVLKKSLFSILLFYNGYFINYNGLIPTWTTFQSLTQWLNEHKHFSKHFPIKNMGSVVWSIPYGLIAKNHEIQENQNNILI